VDALARPATEAVPVSDDLDQIVERRIRQLTDYQDAAYARRYESLVREAQRSERARCDGHGELTKAVARNYARLLAYKDEYEVARLFTDGEFHRQLDVQFEGEWRLELHLAPPFMAKRDPTSGHLLKRSFGPWMLTAMKALARCKRLRGTPLDLFGKTVERRQERQLISTYETTIHHLLAGLDPDNHAIAVEIASLPAQIRGFGHVKEKNLASAKASETALFEAFRKPRGQSRAA
jgi:indolepyruvate ferredoxin oxidoreductase